MNATEYEKVAKSIRDAEHAIDVQRILIQEVSLADPFDGTAYADEVLKFYRSVGALGEIARGLARAAADTGGLPASTPEVTDDDAREAFQAAINAGPPPGWRIYATERMRLNVGRALIALRAQVATLTAERDTERMRLNVGTSGGA